MWIVFLFGQPNAGLTGFFCMLNQQLMYICRMKQLLSHGVGGFILVRLVPEGVSVS
jgi:hypothetical protein